MARTPIRQLSLIFCLAIALTGCASAQVDLPEAEANRIGARISALAQFGANEDGGIDRVAYSPADLAARTWVMEEMEALGLADIRVDSGGNIRAVRPGTEPDAKPIMFGSHIDSVLGGGNYDGQTGVVASLEVMNLLNAGGIDTRHPMEIIVFSNEEGGLVGSLALTGRLEADTLDVISDSGLSIRDGLAAIGGDPSAPNRDALADGDLAGFIELHIEQGAILDREELDIGIVEGIVGIEWWDIAVTGTANHAGTTPMDQRNDALLAAADMVRAVNETARAIDGRHVATVGRIQALPGAPNVIPGRVEFSLEIRDLDEPKIYSVYDAIKVRLDEISAGHGTGLEVTRINVASHPALTDPHIRQTIAEATDALGLTYQFMPSGAGHDAQDMAGIAPTGMIFVPSKNGISHSPAEFTETKDIANGADVLLRALLLLDAE